MSEVGCSEVLSRLKEMHDLQSAQGDKLQVIESQIKYVGRMEADIGEIKAAINLLTQWARLGGVIVDSGVLKETIK